MQDCSFDGLSSALMDIRFQTQGPLSPDPDVDPIPPGNRPPPPSPQPHAELEEHQTLGIPSFEISYEDMSVELFPTLPGIFPLGTVQAAEHEALGRPAPVPSITVTQPSVSQSQSAGQGLSYGIPGRYRGVAFAEPASSTSQAAQLGGQSACSCAPAGKCRAIPSLVLGPTPPITLSQVQRPLTREDSEAAMRREESAQFEAYRIKEIGTRRERWRFYLERNNRRALRQQQQQQQVWPGSQIQQGNIPDNESSPIPSARPDPNSLATMSSNQSEGVRATPRPILWSDWQRAQTGQPATSASASASATTSNAGPDDWQQAPYISPASGSEISARPHRGGFNFGY